MTFTKVSLAAYSHQLDQSLKKLNLMNELELLNAIEAYAWAMHERGKTEGASRIISTIQTKLIEFTDMIKEADEQPK